jgi:hypothetical protein
LNGTGFILAIFSPDQPNPLQQTLLITSCDLEPTSWEYAPAKHHDTGALLAWLVTWAIVTVRDRSGR